MYMLSRLRILLNRVALRWIAFPKPFTFVGANSSRALCRAIVGTGVKRLMLITDGALYKLGLLNPLVEQLRLAGLNVSIYADVEPDPGYELVLRGVERINQSGAEAVLAVGGGSSIDCAKAIVLCHANSCHPSKLTGVWLYALPRKRGLPFYAIPTTAGTGSEVTIAAVVSDKAAGTKKAIIDPKVVPAMVALDPALTSGLPPFVTAFTGMDALTHAIEAYLSSMASPETDEQALSAATMILRSLPVVCQDGANLEAREDMLVASCMAGMAFTKAGVGYVHALAHQLGGLYHLPHGLANAIVLPYVLDHAKTRCSARLARLADVAGIRSGGMTDMECADAFIAHVRALNTSMGIPSFVKELRMSDYSTIIDRAFAEAHGTYGVPRYMTWTDALTLLDSLSGRSK